MFYLSHSHAIMVITMAWYQFIPHACLVSVPLLHHIFFRCVCVFVRDNQALSLPLSLAFCGMDGGGGGGEGAKSQICFYIESRYGNNMGRRAVFFFSLCSPSPYLGGLAPCLDGP